MAQQPSVLQGPEPVETTDLHFKLQCKLKIFEPTEKLSNGNYNLIAVSQYYGLIFVGNLNGFSVIQTKSIKPSTPLNEFPKKDISLNCKPTYITVDFTQKLLSVICCKEEGAVLYLYNISSLASKDLTPVKVIPLGKIIQNLAAEVTEIRWQPNTDCLLMVCMSDGSVLSLNPNSKDGSVHSLHNSTQAMCLCWSPKGKQIIVGCGNGTLSQYKPDLKLVKTIPAPPLYNGAVIVVSVLWISNYQFAVAYNEKNNSSAFPVITIVNAVKNEPVTIINYDDLTYSTSLSRQHQIYMSHISAWNLILISSANSIELAALSTKDNSMWEQWLLGDASRAELPLNSARQETFPLGMAFDFTTVDTMPWGEGTLPPMPRLLLLSDEGVLCVFNIVNVMTNAPQLCAAPKEQLQESLFTLKSTVCVSDVLTAAVAPPTTTASVSAEQLRSLSNTQPFGAQPAFESSKPTFGFNTSSGFGGFTTQTPQPATPQVTVSIPGKGIVGEIKDIPSIVQQQQQPRTQNQFLQVQQPLQQTTNLVSSTTPVSTSQNLTQKFSTSTTQFGTNKTPAFSFGKPLSASAFGVKAATTQPSVGLKANLSVSQSKPLISQTKPAETTVTQGDIFSGTTNLSQSTPIKALEPVTKPAAAKPSLLGEKEPEPKPEEVSGNVKSPIESSNPTLPELPAVDDSVYWNALQDEIDHFNSELQLLSKRVGTLDYQIGTEDEKIKLRKNLNELYDFWKELKETTTSQSNEVHSATIDLMESFAWLEDAKSRNLQRKNPSFIELKKSEELDPISARHMSDIGHLKYYIENQLQQLTSHLEKEWMDYQDSFRMEVKNQMAVPTLEEVYKTMHFQLQILNKQRLLAKELKCKLMMKKRKNKSLGTFIESTPVLPPVQASSRISELYKLADNLLQLKINREENNPLMDNWEALKTQLKTINDRSKKLTPEKQAALRDILSERDIVKIHPVKTTIESSSFLRSLALEKSAKAAMAKASAKAKEKEKVKVLPSPINQIGSSSTEVTEKSDVKPKSELQKTENQEKVDEGKKQEHAKNMFVFGTPFAIKPTQTKPADKAQTPLFGVVSSSVKDTETKPKVLDPLKPTTLTNTASFTFGSTEKKSEKKVEEPKSMQTFTFGISKPTESVFGKTLPAPKFGEGKPIFGSGLTSTCQTSLKTETSKTVTSTTSVTPATTGPMTTPFVFTSSATTSASTTPLPKINLVIGGKQSAGFGEITTTSQNIFSLSTTSNTPTFGSNMFSATKTVTTTTGSLTTAAQSTGFSFSRATDKKTVPSSESSVISKTTEAENEEVNVVTVDEHKKTEGDLESKTSSSGTTRTITTTTDTSSAVTTQAKPAAVVTTVATSATSVTSVPSVSSQVVFTSPSSLVTTTSIFGKPTTAAETSFASSAPIFGQTVTTVTSTVPVLSCTTTSSPLVFGQTTTTSTTVTLATTAALGVATTSPTTTAASSGLFQQSPTTTPQSVNVSSSTSPTSIFGGSTTANIFGGSTPISKPTFSQVSTSSAPTSGSIFGSSNLTPTTNSFSTSTTSTSAFADSVSQTANIFGQLLSESNRSENLFATSSTASTTTTNIFSTPKNIFGREGSPTTASTTASLFGGSSSTSNTSSSTPLFGQSTSLFGQSNTSPNVFGQSSSNSFFGQNICSPFGGGGGGSASGGSSVTSGFGSKPVFGQNLFGQTNVFGGSSSSSIFGGSSTPRATGTNVFQATTTSPGPFSSNQGSVAETGFKATGTFQKPLGGFGSPPVFGGGPTSTPTFGASPTFSGAATFGSQPTFGSRPGVFDSSQGGFTQSQGSTTFENLANQNTVSFGNFAQQSQSQGFGGFASAPAFENKTAFGGTSFSSWRSNDN